MQNLSPVLKIDSLVVELQKLLGHLALSEKQVNTRVSVLDREVACPSIDDGHLFLLFAHVFCFGSYRGNSVALLCVQVKGRAWNIPSGRLASCYYRFSASRYAFRA